MEAATPSDHFDLESLLAVDELVEVDMETDGGDGVGSIFDMMKSHSGFDVVSV